MNVDDMSEHFSVISNRDSGTLDDVDDLAEINDDGDDVGPPLFLYLTCSVRSKRRSLKSIPVRNLSTCLGGLAAEDVFDKHHTFSLVYNSPFIYLSKF